MAFVLNFPLFCIMFCVISAVACMIFPRRTSALRITGITFALVTAMSVALLVYVSSTGEAYTYQMGQFPAPFGNELHFGTFEVLMATVFSAVSLLSVIGGARDAKNEIAWKKVGAYYLMLNLLICAMLAIIYTNDLFTAYVFIDVITIAACTIIAAKRTGKTLVATTTYLILSLIGSAILLLSFAILYGVTGHLLLPDLGESVRALLETGEYNPPLFIVTALMVIGLGVKSALFPFHSWHPDASSGTTTTSAVLSGLIIKVYLIFLIKLFFRVFGPEGLAFLHITDMLFVFGLAGILWGAFQASKQRDIKRMLAYSSVSQIGFISAGIGLGLFESIAAAAFHILVHALAKSMLFCTAGALSAHCGHKKDFESLRGTARKSPLMGIAFAVGALSLIGIPPFPGFFSKLFLGTAALASPFWIPTVFVVVVFGSLLSTVYFIPAVVCLFARPPDGEITVRRRENRPAIAAVGAFMALNILLGLMSTPVMRLIEQGLSVLG